MPLILASAELPIPPDPADTSLELRVPFQLDEVLARIANLKADHLVEPYQLQFGRPVPTEDRDEALESARDVLVTAAHQLWGEPSLPEDAAYVFLRNTWWIFGGGIVPEGEYTPSFISIILLQKAGVLE